MDGGLKRLAEICWRRSYGQPNVVPTATGLLFERSEKRLEFYRKRELGLPHSMISRGRESGSRLSMEERRCTEAGAWGCCPCDRARGNC